MNNRIRLKDGRDIFIVPEDNSEFGGDFDFDVLVATCVRDALFDGMDGGKPFGINVLIDPVSYRCQIQRNS